MQTNPQSAHKVVVQASPNWSRMSPFLRGPALALGLATLLVSCTSSPTGYGGACPANGVLDPPMIFPANGATGVPTNVGTIYFGAPDNQPSAQVAVELTTPGSAVVGGALVAAPSPLPSGVPNSGGSVSQASVPVLASGTTYAVTLVGTGSPCPQQFDGSSGSFTTQ